MDFASEPHNPESYLIDELEIFINKLQLTTDEIILR